MGEAKNANSVFEGEAKNANSVFEGEAKNANSVFEGEAKNAVDSMRFFGEAKNAHSLRIASAGDMRVTKYEGPTSIIIEAMASPILISNQAENERYTGTWST